MENRYFISYSGRDAQDEAAKIFEIITSKKPNIKIWWDKNEKRMRHANDWTIELEKGIKSSEGLIFLMTEDSVHEESVCRNELIFARNFKKPIILVRIDYDVAVPLLLNAKQHIDFSDDFEHGIEQLIDRLEWLKSPEGKLVLLENQLAHMERELKSSKKGSRKSKRLGEQMEVLRKQIADQQQVINDPEGAKKRVEDDIKKDLQKGFKSKTKESDQNQSATSRFIHSPPLVAPAYFQNRAEEIGEISAFLHDDAQRVMMVAGDSGIGKTALVCKVLKSLEEGVIPGSGEPAGIDGIIYLSETGFNKINFNNIFNGLCRLLPKEETAAFEKLNATSNVTPAQIMVELLSKFAQKKVIVLLDNFEDKLDPKSSEIADQDLEETLKVILQSPHHSVKCIITSRQVPLALAKIEPGKQKNLHIELGLGPQDATNLLRAMDKNGKLGLQDASEELLIAAYEQTKGNPRALETLFALLSADINATLEDILESTQRTIAKTDADADEPAETMAELLADEAFNRLGADAQMVMQALAIYDEPIIVSAVNYLLLPFIPGIDSEAILQRLHEAQFVQEDEGWYTISSEYAEYALGRIAPGDPNEREQMENPPFTMISLYLRAADYWKLVRVPDKEVAVLLDLMPQIKEIKIRTKAEDYNTAAEVLEGIYGYLFSAGEFRLIIDLLDPIIDKIRGYDIVVGSLYRLGRAMIGTTQYYEAVSYFSQALEFAEQEEFKEARSLFLSYLGDCYTELGKTVDALNFYISALQIDHEILEEGTAVDDYPRISENYRKVGECFLKIGNYEEAVKYFEFAQNLSGEADLRGLCYIYLGRASFLTIADAIPDAIGLFQEILKYGDDVPDTQLQSDVRYGLGVAYLYSDELASAMEMLVEAQGIGYPPNEDNILAAMGVTALRLGDHAGAREAFEATIKEVEMQLTFAEENYDGLYSMAHAQVGLALLEDDHEARLEEALDSYRKALTVNADYGVFNKESFLFRALFPADEKGILDEVGETIGSLHATIVDKLITEAAQERGEVGTYLFRKDPLQDLDEITAQQLIIDNNFYDAYLNPDGEGIPNNLELFELGDEQLIVDHATGLHWQYSGEYILSFANAVDHVQDLNESAWGGYTDWRLPTLDEAMSLMNPKKENRRYVNPVFHKEVTNIWTADMQSSARSWQVDYAYGHCSAAKVKGFWAGGYVRAVRG